MNKNHFDRLNRVILLGTLVTAMLTVVRPSMAQSSQPLDKWDSLATSGNPASGEQVFHSVGCADCHGEDARGMDGPALIKTRLSFQQFVHWVRNASSGMDPFPPDAVSDAQLADIYAFVQGKSKPSNSQPTSKPENHAEANAPVGDPGYGDEVYHRVGCVECHGQNAEGSDGPSLLKIKMSFPEFVHWVRNASNGMDPQPPAIVSDAELADIYAYIEGNSKSAGPQPAAKPENNTESGAPAGNVANGGQLFHTIGCAKCHGENAEGSIGPSLVHIKKGFP